MAQPIGKSLAKIGYVFGGMAILFGILMGLSGIGDALTGGPAGSPYRIAGWLFWSGIVLVAALLLRRFFVPHR